MGLFICLRLFDYITYTVFYGTLTLFLIHQEGMSSATALLLAGSFIGLNYGCSLIGGALLEWISDLRPPLFIGVTLHFLGMLLFFKFDLILPGLSVFILGSLAFDSSFFLALTRLYQDKLATLQKAFYYNYLGMNVGGLIGFTLGGFMQLDHSAHLIVGGGIIVFLASIIILLTRTKFLAQIKSPRPKKSFTSIYQFLLYPLLLILAGGLIFTVLKIQAVVSTLVISLWAGVYVAIWAALLLQKNKFKPAYKHFLILALAYLLFWTVYFIIPTLMALFLNSNVDLNFYHWRFSPAWFINIMCLVVIIGILRTIKIVNKRALNIERQFALGFILQIIALAILVLGILLAGLNQVALLWAVLYFTVQACAEFTLAPIAYSSVGQLIEKKFQAFFMGFWLASLGVAVIIASKVSALIAPHLHSSIQDNPVYMYLFLALAAVSFMGLMLIALKHYLFKL